MFGAVAYGFKDGFIVQSSNEKKPRFFIVRHPQLTTQMLPMVSYPPAEQSKTVEAR
jgi:hypothetical protein